MTSSPFHLKVHKFEQICQFELSWGQGQRLIASLKYPAELTRLYGEWQRFYLNFYRTAPTPISAVQTESQDSIRGWEITSGSPAPTATDWQPRLVEAQMRLLNEFNRWLRSAELHDIRREIAEVSGRKARIDQSPLTVFLSCTPIELARLPWEVWELGADFAGTGVISIVRTPTNIRSEPTPHLKRRHRSRVLAIMGDKTGLNFQKERSAIQSLSRKADVKFIGWQPGQTAAQVKDQIRQCLTDEQGWDVLFFAGHSNETKMTGGELGIAPGVTIYIHEIASQLTTAKQRGLQFALFNSCSGLSIAESLIDIGFSQVAVMREPISNALAIDFFTQFARGLAEHQDVHEALLSACQFLKLEKSFYYPSGFLIPSLFCHPGAELFRIVRSRWKRSLRQLVPTRHQAIVFVFFLLIGLSRPTLDFLLDHRTWVQAMFRQVVEQFIPAEEIPPVALIQIDKKSVDRAEELRGNPAPISPKYLARLVDQLTQSKAKIIGIDYLLKTKSEDTEALRDSLVKSVRENKTWFVFAAGYKDELENRFVAEDSGTANNSWSLQGGSDYPFITYPPNPEDKDAPGYPGFIDLPTHTEKSKEACIETCPFAFLLAFIHKANETLGYNMLQPYIERRGDLRTELIEFLERRDYRGDRLDYMGRWRIDAPFAWVDMFLPIVDYSIPPYQIYRPTSACEIVGDCEGNKSDSFDPSRLSKQVVIIGAGEYKDPDAAVDSFRDLYPLPSAVHYWRKVLRDNHPFADQKYFTGAEATAYMVHHLLSWRIVVPVPYVFMIGTFALLGKVVALRLQNQQQQKLWTRSRRRKWIRRLCIATVLYGLLSLQVYISGAILIPWFLPSLLFWVYIHPNLWKKPNT